MNKFHQTRKRTSSTDTTRSIKLRIGPAAIALLAFAPAAALATQPLPDHHPTDGKPHTYDYTGRDSGPRNQGVIGDLQIWRKGGEAGLYLYDSKCGEFRSGWVTMHGESFHDRVTAKNGYGFEITGTFTNHLTTLTGTIKTWGFFYSGKPCHTPTYDYTAGTRSHTRASHPTRPHHSHTPKGLPPMKARIATLTIALLALAPAGALAARPLPVITGSSQVRPSTAPVGKGVDLAHVHWTKWTASEAVGTGTFTCANGAMGVVCPPVKRATVTYYWPVSAEHPCGSRESFSREMVVAGGSSRWATSGGVWMISPGNCQWTGGASTTGLNALLPITARRATPAERTAISKVVGGTTPLSATTKITVASNGRWALMIGRAMPASLIERQGAGWSRYFYIANNFPCSIPANVYLAFDLAAYNQVSCGNQ